MFREQIIRALQKVTGQKDVRLETPEVEEYGDYSANVAMLAFSKTPKIQTSKTPRELAEGIVEKLKRDKNLKKTVERIEVAGPGFINFWLSHEALLTELEKAIKEGDKYGSSNLGKNKTVVIDYSSPNIAKRFGIGHMRSTIIGQALYNLYSFLGYKVIGDNHLGDWGTQFGTLLFQINNKHLTINKLTIEKLEELYVDFNKRAEDNPKLWEEARAWFKKLEDGDKQARKIWKKIVDISMREFKKIYDLLGVKIDNAYGESFYEDKMRVVVDEVCQKGLMKKSRGAEIVEFPHTGSGRGMPPAMLTKSDGATTYYTRDLATLKFRIDKWSPDLIIYEVGSEQTLHFRQLFETAKLLSWAKDRELVHVAHGLIRGKSGKLATRRGETVNLKDVLNEAIERAGKIIDKSETSRGLSDKDRRVVAKAVGVGAIKYFDLMHHPSSDIIFDWEKMFLLEGNSAPYLQYTVARTNSVLGKVKSERLKVKDISNLTIKQFNNEELAVLRAMVHFPEIIVDAARSYSPNILCNYLFDLAQKFNAFYNAHRILVEDPLKLKLRLELTLATGQILANGLNLLGINTPQRM